MGNLAGKFSDQNDIVLTGITQTANNNTTSLSAAIAETDQLRSSNVIFQPSGLLVTPGNLVPNVTQTLQGTIGAALGGIGQGGSASEQPGGGGIPCFSFATPVDSGSGQKAIGRIETGIDTVWAFDDLGNRIDALVVGKHEHYVTDSLIVRFADGRWTHTTADHLYWTQEGFEPVFKLDSVWHWSGEWKEVAILEKIAVSVPLTVYNLEVDIYKTYFANGDAVHNLKPLPTDEIA